MGHTVDVLSHWHQSVEELNTSSLEFYDAVEKSIRAKNVAAIQLERVEVPEQGVFSAKRTYLAVTYGRLRFDICGAPFGTDFFFSWWLVRKAPGFHAVWGCTALVVLPLALIWLVASLGFVKGVFFAVLLLAIGFVLLAGVAPGGWSEVEDSLLATPVIGPLYGKFFKPVTYYSEDSRLMFEETVHRVVLEIVAGILTLHKLPELPAEGRKPQSKKPLL